MSIIHKIKEAPVTYFLLIISSIIYLYAQIVGEQGVKGLIFFYDQVPKRWYTLLTYGFVQVEGYHIVMNMSVLLLVGAWVERLLGWKRYSILVVTSIFIGGLSLLLIQTSGKGFSAAASAILFYYYLAYPLEKEWLFSLPNFVLPCLVIIFSVLAMIFNWLPMVGHFPHVTGGLYGGCLILAFKKWDSRLCS